MNTKIPMSLLRKSAIDVVEYIATDVLGSGWSFAFGKFDTAYLTHRADPRSSTDPAWRLCWAGLFEEAQEGDVDKLLRRILRHSAAIEDDGRTLVNSENVPEWLHTRPPESDETKDVSLLVSSKIRRLDDGSVMHIPMMDFRCEPSETSVRLITDAMKRLGQKSGVILESGQSYHYYGFDLFSERDWQVFMYQCLLLTPFADPRYIGHRLLAGTARLRITGSRAKPVIPYVVAVLG